MNKKKKAMVTVITGAGTGIGRALAKEFHSRGHIVYATDRELQPLKELEDRDMRIAALDVTDAEMIKALVARLKSDGAEVDLLINNAGYGLMGPLAELKLDAIRRQFEVNVFAVVALIQAFLPGMVACRSGRIINISSISGVMATPFAGAYCASKSAVNALSDTLRMEVAPFGIKVITVQPGGVRSDFGATAGKSASELSQDSLYAPIADAIQKRAHGGQEDAMPAEEFARKMADAVLAANPQPIVRIGAKTMRMLLAKKYLPESMLDQALSQRFKLDKLRRR